MRHIVLGVIACLLISCHEALPTEETAFQKFIIKQGDKNNAMFEFIGFKKAVAIKRVILGKNVYVIDYHVKQIAKEDIHECTAIGKTYFLTDSAIVADSIKQSQFKTGHIDRPNFVKGYKKGELIKELDGKITFTKTNGVWK